MLKLYIKSLLLLAGLALFSHESTAQRVEISRIFFEHAKVHVQYELIDDRADRSYQIQLYGSIDNYISPLKEVSGDIGVEIFPGEQKEIIWDPFAEFGDDFNDEIALEIRGRVYIPFVKLDDFNFKSIKRDKPYTLTWTGGSASNILNIELYNSENNKVEVFSNIANVGEYVLVLPKNTKPAKGYRLRISDKMNKDDVVYSKAFKVVRRIPLVAQVGGGVIVAGGIYYLITQLGDEPQNNGIESAPATPEEN